MNKMLLKKYLFSITLISLLLMGFGCVSDSHEAFNETHEALIRCDVNYFYGCSGEEECVALGGQWIADGAFCTDNCTADDFSSCFKKDDCLSVGGEWFEGIDQSDEQSQFCIESCSTNNFEGCLDETSCTQVGGNWLVEIFMNELGEEEFVEYCSSSCSEYSIEFCSDEFSCVEAGGEWFEGIDQSGEISEFCI